MKGKIFLLLIFLMSACTWLPENFNAVPGTTVFETYDYIVLEPSSGSDPVTGVIFYPGGLVDAHAYIPLVSRIATNGYYGFIVKPPLNLQAMSWSMGDSVMNAYNQVTNWFVGGHSLGGTMAARYYHSKKDELNGMFMLAAWAESGWDLSSDTNDLLLITAEFDLIADAEEIESNAQYIPTRFWVSNTAQPLNINGPYTYWYDVSGGNHTGFGNYAEGRQTGDGEATKTPYDQQNETAEIIVNYIQGRGF